MKKKLLCTLTALCMLSAFAFTSCKDNTEEETSQDNAAQLTESIEECTSEESTTDTPSEEASEISLAEKAKDYFQDAAFIGDSVSMALRNRCTSNGKLPGATFLVRGSYGSGHAVNSTMYLTYQGVEMSPEDAIKASGAKKVFIMLGMNDLNIYGLEGTIENWRILTSNIKAKNPGVQIYIQTMTPIVTGSEAGKLNNPTIDEYNTMLMDFALENGFAYIDVATDLKTPANGLDTTYCSDNYVHLSSAGVDVWIAKLEKFAENQYL